MRQTCVVILGVLGAGVHVLAARGADEGQPVDFAVVKQVVLDHFAGLADYRHGDIISRSQVRAAVQKAQKKGWKAPDVEELLKRVPDDDEWLVKRLRSREGRELMRGVARQPNGYEKLEHLSKLSDGKQLVNQLIKGPDGYKLVEYLSTAKGGKELEKMLSKTPQGHDFGKRTGRIYTADDLLNALSARYAAGQQSGDGPSKSPRK